MLELAGADARFAARAGASFDAGKGRPMREWVVIDPRIDEEQWLPLATEAMAFVAASAGNPSSPAT